MSQTKMFILNDTLVLHYFLLHSELFVLSIEWSTCLCLYRLSLCAWINAINEPMESQSGLSRPIYVYNEYFIEETIPFISSSFLMHCLSVTCLGISYWNRITYDRCVYCRCNCKACFFQSHCTPSRQFIVSVMKSICDGYYAIWMHTHRNNLNEDMDNVHSKKIDWFRFDFI